jgi:rubrerythrin
MFTASDIFDLAIQVEMNGERIYRHAAGKVEQGDLKQVLSWLADEELRHQDAFLRIKGKINEESKSGQPLSEFSEDEAMLLRSAMGRHAFSLDEFEAESIRSERELLDTAILFEEDAIQFFEFIAGFVSDPAALTTIAEIRGEELNHKRLLMEKSSEIR